MAAQKNPTVVITPNVRKLFVVKTPHQVRSLFSEMTYRMVRAVNKDAVARGFKLGCWETLTITFCDHAELLKSCNMRDPHGEITLGIHRTFRNEIYIDVETHVQRPWVKTDVPETVAHELEHHVQEWNLDLFPEMRSYSQFASSKKIIEKDADETAKKLRKKRMRKKKWQIPGQ
jgi:hypothetical protein